ncbi:glucosamine inositolphosphorylceramide transferase family protein [Rhizobium paknamense]|uniref:Glucosamine inositolphosphorylceramide transferase 1 N-terminal domain-containing protein n=1 Tax=Rhizobium paknamense TaxID=1206817 RepID=A0ABU0IJE4_9HYPH|nr:hypothetical protein [Rhizobium paknamense]MDQ0458356.1 hypothetical protein [Rhizobium paknamense]
MWSIGIYEGDSIFSMKPSTKIRNPVITIDSITDVRASLVADPFMIFVNKQWYMFFEVMNEDERKGEIGAATSKDLLKWEYIGIVLKESFHLSYPFIFVDGDDVYMAPETLGAGGVVLYKAVNFPHSWHQQGMLVKGTHADPTIIKHEGLWWLFSCTTPYQHDSLSISWAENLHGPWLPHDLNPVYSDSKSISRPAGRMVDEGGNILRFFQNCSRIYGESVGVAKIQRLSKDHYDEHIKEGSDVLGPSGIGWNATRMHHIDCHRTETGSWVACVDGHV